MRRKPLLACLALLVGASASSGAWAQDGGASADGGPDAGTVEPADGGSGPQVDAGAPDAGGLDAGGLDAGNLVDGGVDLDGGPDPDPDPQPDPDPDPQPDPEPDPVGCDIVCEGEVLRFCDAVTGEPREVDCTELGGRCGLLSDTWGLDCLLPEGAACSPSYAEGRSRCDPIGPLYCRNGRCTDNPNEVEVLPEIPNTAGGIGDTTGDDPGPLACLGCDDSGFPFSFAGLFVALGWQRFRRRRRRARAG